MTRSTQGKIVKGAAFGIDVLAPLAATITQFPIWVERSSGATVSGLFLLFAMLSAIPFYKQIKEYMKSPSAPIVWTVIFTFLILLRNIIDEMVIVCFVGMLANILGAGLYNLGKIIGGEERTDK